MTERSGVGRTTARAAIWSFVSTGGAKAITLVSLMVLAGILAPREFGLLAFALAYISYAETIGDLGSGMALVYWPDRREEAAQVTFITNVAAGIFWTLFTIAIAPFVADFFNAPNGEAIVRVLAVSFLIKFLGNTHDALAQKDLRFRARVIPELGMAAIKATVAIVLGYLGFGAWSLVWGHIAGLLCWTIALWVAVPWRPSRIFPRDLFGPMLRYGRGIISLNVLSAVNHHSDLAVVGRFAGLEALGLYQIASKIPEATVIVAIWALNKVLFPAFSRIAASGEGLERAYLMATRYLSAVTLPAGIGLALLAKPVILLAFGTEWLRAAPILAFLAIHAAIRSLSNPPGDVLNATGRAWVLAWLAFARAIVTVPALVIAATYSGAPAVAATLAAVALLSTIATGFIVQRLINVTLRATLASLAPSFAAVAAMAAALAVWNQFTTSLVPLAQAVGGVVLGAAVYFVALRIADPALVRRAVDMLRSRRSSEQLVKAARQS